MPSGTGLPDTEQTDVDVAAGNPTPGLFRGLI